MVTQKELVSENWTAIVLAAGKGTRMKSPLPKVLHPVGGRPMLVRIVEKIKSCGFSEIRLVVGAGQTLVQTMAQALSVPTFIQEEQKGTAHAVMSAEVETLEGFVLIVNGDHPLIESHDIAQLTQDFLENAYDLAVVTATLKNPGSFGRIVRHMGQIQAIVEAKDASHQTLKIKEVNTGIYCMKASLLKELLPKIQNHNAQKEYYLTDLVALALQSGKKVGTLQAHSRVAFGVNTQAELARASRYIYRKKAKDLMEQGVLILDPSSVYIEETVQIEPGSAIYPNVFIRGSTRIGAYSSIEPNCFIVDSLIDRSVQIKAGSYLERVRIGSEAQVGPYARLRPETEIGPKAQVGNFVEMKKVRFGAGSKANHLSYLGDAEVGEQVNIGCGTITCNYAVDRKKYKTKIGNHVFVGSDSQFVAPVEVGDHAIIASGSTITQNVPEWALAIARGKQENKLDWAKRLQEVLERKKDTQEGSKVSASDKESQ